MSVINYFGEMTDFLDFEAVKDSNVNEIDNTEENLVEDVIDDDFIGDENEFHESFAGYYAFTSVIRSVEDAMQDSFIDFDYSRETKDYCPEDYDRINEIIDEFKDSGKKLRISKVLSRFQKVLKISTRFIMQFFTILDMCPKIKKMSAQVMTN